MMLKIQSAREGKGKMKRLQILQPVLFVSRS
jgi:hypothetical protein